MAAYELIENFDVHVYNCHTEECEQVIKQLADALSSKCKCIAEYKPFGLEREWFVKHLNSSTYTVVHICEKVNRLISSLPIDAAQSMMCVKFSSGSKNLTPHGSAKFSLSEFRQYNISSQAGLDKFVAEVISHLPKPQSPEKTQVYRRQRSINVVRPHSACFDFPPSLTADIHDTPLQTLQAILDSQSNKGMRDRTDSSAFTTLPDIFGDQPEARSVNVTSKNEAPIIKLSSLTTWDELTEVVDSQCGNFSSTDASYIMHEVLPAFYKYSIVEGLVSVAVSKHPALQERSLTLLEMFCLTRDDSVTTKTSQLNVACSLRTAQNKLIEFAEKLSNRIEDGVDQEISLSMLHQACNLLLLMQSQIGNSCFEDSIYASDGTSEKEQLPELKSDLRSTKSSRSLPGQSFRFGSTNEKKTSFQHLTSVTKILQEAKKKKKKQEKILPKFLSYVSGGFANVCITIRDLINSEPHTQMMVLAECLRQIFLKKGPCSKNLSLLADYVNPKQSKRPARVFLRMILRGLTHFLHFSIERSKDTSDFCKTVMDIFERIWRYERNQVEDVVRGLMFDSMPSVRQGIVTLFKSRNVYHENLPHFLIKEAVKILSPCFQVDSMIKREGWLVITGKFSNIPAIAYIHSIFYESHFDQNKDQLKGIEDRLHMNQLTQLKNLGQNPSLVKLLAFSIKCAPQFYIIEYFNINLQQELKNRWLNQSMFDPLTLLEFVTQAAEALKYCHSQGVIHCSLTASSLFVSSCGVEDKKVIIGCFKMAHKLKSRDGHDIISKIDYKKEEGWLFMSFLSMAILPPKIETRRYLPVRWTAPESLRRSCFSLASDVWMFGHLVYEVMTHGVLPYSNEYGFKEDTELVLNFYPQLSLRNPPQLPREPCIASKVWDIIVDCTQLHAVERSTMPEITTRLQTLLAQQKNVEDPKPVNYPKIQGKRQHSSEYCKGIPSTSDTTGQYVSLLQASSQKQLSPLIEIYETDKVLIFQSTYKGQLGSALHFAEDIFNGVLEPLLPPLFLYSIQGYSSVIDCHLPKEEVQGPLWDICAQRKLGPSLVTYIDICLQWARTLQAVQGRLYALAYFGADSMWVLKREGKYEIVPVMLSYLWHSASETSCQFEIPSEAVIMDRCSPELMSNGIVQESSDVYSFGVLFYQVLHAYFLRERDGGTNDMPAGASASENFSYSMGQPYDGGNIRSQILQCDFSDDLPRNLTNLIHSCVETDSCERPKWPEIICILKSVLNELQGFCQRKAQSTTMKRLDVRGPLSVRNPSSVSDSETDSSVPHSPSMTASKGHTSCHQILNPSTSEDDTTSVTSAEPDMPYIPNCNNFLQNLSVVVNPSTSQPSRTHFSSMNNCCNSGQDSISGISLSLLDRIKSSKNKKSLESGSQLTDDEEEQTYHLYSRPSDLPRESSVEPMWEDEEWYDEGTYFCPSDEPEKSTDFKTNKYESEAEGEQDLYETLPESIDSSEEAQVKVLQDTTNDESIYMNVANLSGESSNSMRSLDTETRGEHGVPKTLPGSQKYTSEETQVKVLLESNDEGISLSDLKSNCSDVNLNENNNEASSESSAKICDGETRNTCQDICLNTKFDSTDSSDQQGALYGKTNLSKDIGKAESPESDVQRTQLMKSGNVTSSTDVPIKRNPTDPLPCPPCQEKL